MAGKAAKKQDLGFSEGEFAHHRAHGVGIVEGVVKETIAGIETDFYVITFEENRMRMKVPVMKADNGVDLRKLSSKDRLKDAMTPLKGKSRIKRTMWSRRAQEYEAKINSGDPVAVAEVLRDLRRKDDQSEQSFSERQIYQQALERLAREYAVVEKINEETAAEKLEEVLTRVA